MICFNSQMKIHLETGHALGIWISGCRLFYRRKLWASKSAGFSSTKSLEICGCKRGCPKDIRIGTPKSSMLMHFLRTDQSKQQISYEKADFLNFRICENM